MACIRLKYGNYRHRTDVFDFVTAVSSRLLSYWQVKIFMTTFFILLFVLSWVGTIPMVLSSYHITISGPLRILQVLMFFGAGIAAVFCSWRDGGKQGVRNLLKGLLIWRVNPLLYVAVFLGPAVVFLASLFFSKQAGATTIGFPDLQKALVGFLSTFVVYFFLNTEELAWRGYALPRLQAKYGALKASAWIGVLWTVFHLPLFLMKGGHPAGYPFWLFAIMILAWTIPFTSLYNGSGGSVLLTHMLHQSMNASVEAIPIYPVITKSLLPIGLVTAASVILSAVLILGHIGLRVRESRRSSPAVIDAHQPACN
jgi:membrane protease YdiL (CAAX protease family)